MKAIITVGISASGKTTFAKELVAQGWVDVNRDDIRFDLFCGGHRDWKLYKFSKDKENRVTQVQESMVEKAIQEQLTTEFLNNQLTYCGYIIDDFEAWMPRIKLLRSKSKQSRMVAVVVNC